MTSNSIVAADKRRVSADPPPNERMGSLSGFYATVLGCAAAVWLACVCFIVVVARVGGPYVDFLSRLGEAEATRAADLAKSDMVEEAIAQYRKALSVRFINEPGQRILAQQELARLLIKTDRCQEAISVLEESRQLDDLNYATFWLLFQAYRALGREDKAADLCENYFTAVTRADNQDGIVWARYARRQLQQDTLAREAEKLKTRSVQQGSR